jgi:hypothetical protein
VEGASSPFRKGEEALRRYLPRLVSRIAIRLILHTLEAVGICRVADCVPSDLREGTQGPLELDAACRSVVYIMRRNDLLRGNALLHPAFESF